MDSLTGIGAVGFNGLRPRVSVLAPWKQVKRLRWRPVGLFLSCCLGIATPSAYAQTASTAESASNPIIEVGIVQRFGEERSDRLILEPNDGRSITLKFEPLNLDNAAEVTLDAAADGTTEPEPQVVTTNGAVRVEVVPQPLAEPEVIERVVLSTHRSFESAEDSANYWKAQGIEVEITQPRQWQVWARRDTYRTPLLRRLLLRNAQANGSSTVFLDQQRRTSIPNVGFVVNGTRIISDVVEIRTTDNRLYVNETANPSDRQLFAGTFQVQPNAYGTYTLVNNVSIETYLRGVVPFEIGPGAPPTTIQAQAILARTYALRNLRRFTIDDYHLCADTQCQVYRGLSGAATSTDRAIAATAGLVLTHNNELVDALYSSTTGGVTAAFSHVWNGPDRPYLRARIDSVREVWDLERRPLSEESNLRAFISLESGFNEVGWEPFRWEEESDLTVLVQDLRDYLQSKQHPLANFETLESLEVVERSVGGRVQQLRVTTDLGQVVLKKDEVLRALSAPRSTLFYLEPQYSMVPEPQPTETAAPPAPNSEATDILTPDSAATEAAPDSEPPTPRLVRSLTGYRFVGGGWGHAVGLSQTGAMNLGDLGWSPARILSFYYPGTSLVPLNESIVFWREPEPS
ncbi:MAG: SpoIID/LytB domain-containing protein [Cyanobacteria bacterium J06638_20]